MFLVMALALMAAFLVALEAVVPGHRHSIRAMVMKIQELQYLETI
jgi:hypothetical protein